MIVLDTNILSELMRPAPNPAVVAWLDRQKPGDVATTTITVAEILFGIERLPAGQRRDTFTVLAADMFDQDFARRLLPWFQSLHVPPLFGLHWQCDIPAWTWQISPNLHFEGLP